MFRLFREIAYVTHVVQATTELQLIVLIHECCVSLCCGVHATRKSERRKRPGWHRATTEQPYRYVSSIISILFIIRRVNQHSLVYLYEVKIRKIFI